MTTAKKTTNHVLVGRCFVTLTEESVVQYQSQVIDVIEGSQGDKLVLYRRFSFLTGEETIQGLAKMETLLNEPRDGYAPNGIVWFADTQAMCFWLEHGDGSRKRHGG